MVWKDVKPSSFWSTKGHSGGENRKCLYKGSSGLTHLVGIHEIFKGIDFLFTDLLCRTWWASCLLLISSLLLLLLVCCLRSHYFARVEEAHETVSSRLETDLLRIDNLYALITSIQRRREFWSIWTTRIFIAIVLSCVGVYLISQYPGASSPVWLGIVLQVFIYVSAFLFYKMWGKTEEEE